MEKENFIYGDLRQNLKKSLGFAPICRGPLHDAASGSAIAQGVTARERDVLPQPGLGKNEENGKRPYSEKSGKAA